MRTRLRLVSSLVLAAAVAAGVITCTGDNASPDRQTGPDVPLLAGAPTSLKISIQPPSSALDREVWIPSLQPSVVVKDANGVGVPGVLVTASAIGSGTLQGKTGVTTSSTGVAKFVDLGIAGTGDHTLRFSTTGPSATSAKVTLSALPPEATSGDWGASVSWDIVPLHMSLLPTGRVLAWGKYETGTTSASEPRLWNPASGPPTGAAEIAEPDMLFCSGHTLMADGRLMVSGGHYGDDRGLRVTNIFDPVSQSWTTGLPKMALGRWYPTVTMLADGRMVTVAGRDSASRVVTVPEIWENGTWVRLPGASFTFPYYPRQFLAPNGKIFYAGERIQARWLDVDATTTNGRGKWTSGTGLKHLWGFNRDYGSAVMYETGKVLVVGGGGNTGWSTPDARSPTPTATAETIDLNGTAPAWKNTEPMQFRRRHLNATILPDGQVLVTGGTSGGGFNDLANAVHAAEVWDPDPAPGHWTTLASNSVDRVYHSVSLLLPDATVLHGASGDANDPQKQPYPPRRNHEIFRPPYLFKGARPVITGLSQTTVGYSNVFTVNTSYAQQITQVRWIRLGSVTHGFDAGQRANSLTFTQTATAVKVTTPSSAKKAPPGYYLLFILNRNGVPSAGSMVRVH
jgi:hypothetical protein